VKNEGDLEFHFLEYGITRRKKISTAIYESRNNVCY